MPMPKGLSKAGRAPGDVLADDGCQYGTTCTACPWRECIWLLSKDDRHIFHLAYRTLATFKAAPDAERSR